MSGAVERRCGPMVGIEKPKVWHDGDAWNCDQTVRCAKCHILDFNRLAEDATWEKAVAACSLAAALDPGVGDGREVRGE